MSGNWKLGSLLFVAGSVAVVLAVFAIPGLFTGGGPGDVIVPPPSSPRNLEAVADPSLDLAETVDVALERVHEQLTAARAKPERRGDVADLLMRVAELYREVGRDRDARAAYTEVQEIRNQSDHWQSREAVRRTADLDAEAGRSVPELDELRQARELHRSAVGLLQRGRYLQAVAVCERALATRNELLPASHHDRAETLLLLGQLQLNRGELYGKAFDTLTAARELLQKTLGPDHPAYASSLHWIATLEDDRGAFVEAQDLYTAALEVLQRARGEFSREYARTLARLARMHADWWVTGAEGKMLRAMHIRDTALGSNHPDYAESLQDLGVLAFHLLQPERAKDLFTKARTIREAALGIGHPLNAETLSWLGRAMTDEVDLTFGHEFHRQAVAVAEQAYGPDHPLVARYLGNFARMCSEENDFDRGDRMFVRAIGIRTRHGLARHPDHAGLIAGRAYNLYEWLSGVVYWENREVDLGPAQKVFNDALRHYERLPNGERLPDFAGTLLDHSQLYYLDEYRTESREFCRALIARAQKLMEGLGTVETHPNYSTFLSAQAYIAMSEGDYPTAQRVLGELVRYSHGRFGHAFPYRRMTGSMLRVGQRLHQGAQGGPLTEETLQDFEATREADRRLTVVAQAAQSTPARLGMTRSHSELTSGLLSLVLRFQAPFDPYQQMLRLRGMVASAQTVDQHAHDRPELASLIARLRDARRELTRAVYTPPPREADRPAWLAEVHRLCDAKDDLESEIAIGARRAFSNNKTPTIDDVQAALAPGTVLIEYCGFQLLESPPTGRGRLHRVSSMVAFAVRKDRPPVLVPLGSRARIEAAVSELRAAVAEHQKGGASTKLAAATTKVADLIWKPVATHIGAADTLLIAPDGPVGFVPFAILPGRAAGSYLIEDYKIGYALSGRSVADLALAGPPTGAGILTVGNVDYSAGAQSGTRAAHPVLRPWSKLPLTGVEADTVEQQFAAAWPDAPRTQLRGGHATATGFAQSAAGKPQFVHVAGHGFFADPATFPDLSDGPAGRSGLFSRSRSGHPAVLRNQPLLSGLVLAPGSHPADQLLTAEQVGSLDLRGTELVVLSACETGVGDIATAEGAMSLQRAFLTAGSRSVVGSLWKVDDAATAVLMEAFYRNLWERKQPKLDAMRNAQLEVLRQPDLVASRAERLRGIDTTLVRTLPAPSADGRTDPTLWAAFTLTGDGR